MLMAGIRIKTPTLQKMYGEKFKPLYLLSLYLLSAWAHRSASFLNISGLQSNKNICSKLLVTEVIRAERVAQ